MKSLILLALLAGGSLIAADQPKPPADPFEGAFFPPELVMMAGGQIGLTQQQQDDFRARLEKAQPRSDELRKALESETAALSALAKKERVDEAALLVQLDEVLDAERELRRLHIGLLAALKNLLTPEQQAKLRDIAKSGGAQLKEEVGKRLTEKVQRIHEAAQKWAESGRDPSEIAQAMEEKVKPLINAGKPLEAEAEIDRLLERLNASQGFYFVEPTGGRIAFPGRDQQGRQQLFTVRLDGADRRQLTFTNDNSMPSWSSDGARLVYVRRTPAPKLTIMDEDGGNKRTLVTGDAPDLGPNHQIAYTIAPMAGQPSEIWVVHAEGGTPRQVTSGGDHGGRVHPSWSPDGKRLVYMQLTPQDPAPPDGTNPRLLTTTGFTNYDAGGQIINSADDANAPDWSPAGDVITFWSGQEGCYGQIWRINADGTGRTQLTKAPIPSRNDDPAWSPDGRQILFTTDRSGRIETWVMNADGSNPRFVVESSPGPGPGDAAWQPVRR